uniref:Uncharacterized protein n=1 Tax=Glossina austeni TaxID=7395 RepID=A0A1A9ULQ0_GLOAU
MAGDVVPSYDTRRTQYLLLTMCNTNYTFSATDIEAYGSQAGGSIMYSMEFWETLTKVIIACILSFHTILRLAQEAVGMVRIVEDVFGTAVNPLTEQTEQIKRFTLTNNNDESVLYSYHGAHQSEPTQFEFIS